jgi:hypothetical protein
MTVADAPPMNKKYFNDGFEVISPSKGDHRHFK